MSDTYFPIHFDVYADGKIYSRHSVRNKKEKQSVIKSIEQVEGAERVTVLEK